jgi:hypothetical protein
MIMHDHHHDHDDRIATGTREHAVTVNLLPKHHLRAHESIFVSKLQKKD